MTTSKKAIERSLNRLDPGQYSYVGKNTEQLGDRNAGNGVHCRDSEEPLPNFVNAECERVISHKNCYIVMGRDRPAQRDTGFGGKGDTQAHSIDIVVGRMAHAPDSNMFCDPDFNIDSARIYISQKANIDEYLGLTPGSEISNAKSAIGIKADAVRLVSREGMKLVAGYGSSNSQGGDISDVTFGVDIIANNNSADLQYIPKGDNLVAALKALAKKLDKLNGVVYGILMTQDKFNKALLNHHHITTKPGARTSVSFPAMYAGVVCINRHLMKSVTSLYMHRQEINAWTHNYLSGAGPSYINSRYNKVN